MQFRFRSIFVLVSFLLSKFSLGEISLCTQQLEVGRSEDALTALIVETLDNGILSIEVLEEWVESDQIFNPFDRLTIEQGPYSKVFDLVAQEVSWEGVRTALRREIRSRLLRENIRGRDRGEVEGVPGFTQVGSVSSENPYGEVRLLFEVEGPRGQKFPLVLLKEHSNSTLEIRNYHPEMGIGSTSYPLGGTWRGLPIIYEYGGSLYLGIVLEEKIEFFKFDPDGKKRIRSEREFEVPYKKGDDHSYKPIEAVKVFYYQNIPIFYHMVSTSKWSMSKRYRFFSPYPILIDNDRTLRGFDRIVGLGRGGVLPISVHQGKLPMLGFNAQGEAFRLSDLWWKWFFSRDEKFSESRLDSIEGSKMVFGRYIPYEASQGTLSGKQFYLYRFSAQREVGRICSAKDFIALFWPDTSEYQIIIAEEGEKFIMNPVIFEEGRQVRMAAYVERGYSISLKIYDFEEEEWLETGVQLFRRGLFAGSLDIKVQGKEGIPYHGESTFIQRVTTLEGLEYLLISFEESTGDFGSRLKIYDPIGMAFVEEGGIRFPQRTSKPIFYESEGEPRFIIFTQDPESGSSGRFEYYSLSKKR